MLIQNNLAPMTAALVAALVIVSFSGPEDFVSQDEVLADESHTGSVATGPGETPKAGLAVSEYWSAEEANRFRNDVRAFAADLERQGIARDRARHVARLAVTEAYRFGIPPALVYGVLRIENAPLRSNAVSSAGAVGLMQVMPSVWLSSLGPRYGYDLRDDATNIAMGVHILAHYYDLSKRNWRRALLRYNGCVLGTNTPDCHKYPDRVRKVIEKEARALCSTGSFERCVTIPLYYGFSPEALRAPQNTVNAERVAE